MENENNILSCTTNVKNAVESDINSSGKMKNSIISTDNELIDKENLLDFAKNEKEILVDPVSENVDTCRGITASFSTHSEDDNIFFSKLFPGVSREKVENDDNFKLFARLKDKNVLFTSLYSDYIDLVDRISTAATEKALFSMQNRLSSPGSLACESIRDGFYTKEQVLKMSREEIAKNYDNIRKSQQNW